MVMSIKYLTSGNYKFKEEEAEERGKGMHFSLSGSTDTLSGLCFSSYDPEVSCTRPGEAATTFDLGTLPKHNRKQQPFPKASHLGTEK